VEEPAPPTTCEVRFCLNVTSFNVLAPCYNYPKDVHGVESRAHDHWKSRHKACLALLAEIPAPQVFCLQEFWFYSSFSKLYEKGLGDMGFDGQLLQRTRSKDDGVAIFYNRQEFKVLDRKDIIFDDSGDRVALLLHLKHLKAECSFVVANTHLTFPHHFQDEQMRTEQVRKVIAFVDYYIRQLPQQKTTAIIAGDFNGNTSDPVYDRMLKARYVSTFVAVHNREVKITHKNHRHQNVGVDYVWVKHFDKEDPPEEEVFGVYPYHDLKRWLNMAVKVAAQRKEKPRKYTNKAPENEESNQMNKVTKWDIVSCNLYPLDTSDEQWPVKFEAISDHRPLTASFEINTNSEQ